VVQIKVFRQELVVVLVEVVGMLALVVLVIPHLPLHLKVIMGVMAAVAVEEVVVAQTPLVLRVLVLLAVQAAQVQLTAL
jgi:hypothetical protein